MPVSEWRSGRWSRRRFCSEAASCLALGCGGQGGLLWAQAARASSTNPLRPDVAAIDRERILTGAELFLAEKVTPITMLRSERSPAGPQDYFSEQEDAREEPGPAQETSGFTVHRDALFGLGVRVAGLAAAQLLTGEKRYGDAATMHLRAWFVDGTTRMMPRMEFGQIVRTGSLEGAGLKAQAGAAAAGRGDETGILETLPLVDVVQAIPFLTAAGSLSDAEVRALRGWFGEYLRWLTAPEDSGPRLAALARDRKDHHATSWMLQVAAYTLFTAPDTGAPKNEDRAMTDLRHRFRAVTLRTQVSPEGVFRREISSANAFRDSLFNLDMLACLCVLLSTRFDNVWEYQLEDGPGMQVAVAFHYPFMANRAKWPYRADAHAFKELPGRRVSLLFAARAYQRPEYAALWKTLEPDPAALEVLRTMPVRQPLLWVRQPPRAAE